MKHLSILVPKGEYNNLSSIVGAYKIFTRANQYWKTNYKREMFKIELVGVSKTVTLYDGLFSINPHLHISSIAKTNLIIIPSLNHDFKNACKENQELIDWIESQYHKGSEIASICTGAFLLASTGLLDGKSCSTHWTASNSFKEMFPQIILKEDKLITDEYGLYTNGGAYSFLNLIIYLVEKYFDRETSIYCSKIFQIDMNRKSQSTFSIFNGQKTHGDEMIIDAQNYIENNLNERISIEELSIKFSVGRRSFDRRFIKATGNTPIEYTQRVKVESAKKSFETSRKTINEVMYDVGYSDEKAFREVFKKITGMSPTSYRNRYHKDVLID